MGSREMAYKIYAAIAHKPKGLAKRFLRENHITNPGVK
jgi:hypothetical protein